MHAISSLTEPSTALLHHVGHKFHEVFQLKQGCYSDLPAAKITEMMKSTSLDVSFCSLSFRWTLDTMSIIPFFPIFNVMLI